MIFEFKLSYSYLQVEQSRIKSDSESPPIISEEVISQPNKTSDNESVKSDDVQSQKCKYFLVYNSLLYGSDIQLAQSYASPIVNPDHEPCL